MVAKGAELLEAAVLAVELTELSGRQAMLQTQVSTSLNNISSQLAAVQSELQSQSRALHNVELVQASMQAHSSAVERLAKAIESSTTENLRWRERHELDNKHVADRVTKFQGAIVVITLFAGAVFTVVGMWLNAEISSLRREHLADVQQIRQTDAENRSQTRGGP